MVLDTIGSEHKIACIPGDFNIDTFNDINIKMGYMQFSNLLLCHGFIKMVHKQIRVQGNRHSLIYNIYTNIPIKELTRSGIIMTALFHHYSPFCIFKHLRNERKNVVTFKKQTSKSKLE